MFLWYQMSKVCYAYLSDIDSTIEGHEIHQSRWFTRGWTLQELLAPKHIVFYDEAWIRLGNKTQLVEAIADRTGIDAIILKESKKLHIASIARKMSWAALRETTRLEDRAYSLLGIFGVNMPLLYGEGKRAFIRLQEEIMKISNDESLFAWGFDMGKTVSQIEPRLRPPKISSLPVSSAIGILAEEPLAFRDSGSVLSVNTASYNSFSMTNQGLQITLPVCEGGFGTVGLLSCQVEGLEQYAVGILLHNASSVYVRSFGQPKNPRIIAYELNRQQEDRQGNSRHSAVVRVSATSQFASTTILLPIEEFAYASPEPLLIQKSLPTTQQHWETPEYHLFMRLELHLSNLVTVAFPTSWKITSGNNYWDSRGANVTIPSGKEGSQVVLVQYAGSKYSTLICTFISFQSRYRERIIKTGMELRPAPDGMDCDQISKELHSWANANEDSLNETFIHLNAGQIRSSINFPDDKRSLRVTGNYVRINNHVFPRIKWTMHEIVRSSKVEEAMYC
jgi:hypothetical protein